MGYHILNRYLDLPLRQKMIIWLIPPLLLVIGCIGIVVYYLAADQVIVNVKVGELSIARQVVTGLEYAAESTADTAYFLYMNNEFQSLLSNHVDLPGYMSRNMAYNTIYQLMTTRRFLDSITIYAPSMPPLLFSQVPATPMPYEEFVKTPFYRTAISRIGASTWSFVTPKMGLFAGDNQAKVIYVTALRSQVTLQPLGVIVIGINESDLHQIYNTGKSEGVNIFVTDAKGQIISDQTGQWLGTNIRHLPTDLTQSADWIQTTQQSSKTEWRVVVTQRRQALLR